MHGVVQCDTARYYHSYFMLQSYQRTYPLGTYYHIMDSIIHIDVVKVIGTSFYYIISYKISSYILGSFFDPHVKNISYP